MNKSKVSLRIIVIAIIIALSLTLWQGVSRTANNFKITQLIKDEVFSNIEDVEVKCTPQKNIIYPQACEQLTMIIPSLASIYDDKGKESKKANLIINREELDEGIEKWLKESYNDQEGRKIAQHVVIKYRDTTIIDETYSFFAIPFFK